ncbi:P-loop containing nucleoside triphosphate hydrolases superfamily protein isoform X2 [Wolffia australiana]
MAGRVIVIMGVSGSGKTTVGACLSEDLGCVFLDGDDFHPQSNIELIICVMWDPEKMSKGIPLCDSDRGPWLGAICQAATQILLTNPTVVIACSALKRPFRDALRAANPHSSAAYHVSFFCLQAPACVLADRMRQRSATGLHFMPPSLLQSQLSLLELDDDEGIITVDSTWPIHAILNFIKSNINC